MPAPPRTRTPTGDVVDSLVAAAERILERDGTAALTVRAIAKEAGVAPMGVYNHLGGKAGVLDELFKRGFDALHAAVAAIDRTKPLDGLAELGRCYRRFALDHPARYAVMFDRNIPDFEKSDEALTAAQAAFAEVVDLVESAMDSGAIRRDDPVDVAQRLWSASHGQVSLELRGIGFVEDLAAHQAALTDTIIRGLLP